MKWLNILLTAVFMATFTISSQAAIIFSNTTVITTDGQMEDFSIDLGGKKYKNVTLELVAKGDYGDNGDQSFELLYDYDYSLFYSQYGYDPEVDPDFITSVDSTHIYNGTDFTISALLKFDDLEWDYWMNVPGYFLLSWVNDIDVYYPPYPNDGSNYVSILISGDEIGAAPVPEPSILFLFGAGLIGLVSLKRKKASN